MVGVLVTLSPEPMPAAQKAPHQIWDGTWLDLLDSGNHFCLSFSVNVLSWVKKAAQLSGERVGCGAGWAPDLPQPCPLLTSSQNLYCS